MKHKRDLYVCLLLLGLQLSRVAETAPATCLSAEGATRDQGANVVICGFPKASGNPGGTSVPVACHRQASQVLPLLRAAETNLQSLQDTNVCYLKVTSQENYNTLSLQLVANHYPDGPPQIRLLDSVSEIVGAAKHLVIRDGKLTGINPKVFADPGPTQKDTLTHLILINTEMEALDLGLLSPLTNLKTLVLVSNSKLVRLTNYKSANLPNLKEIVMLDNNQGLVDCRNIKSLPGGLTRLWIMQSGLKGDNCVFCNLPANVSKVVLKQDVSSLTYYPGSATDDSIMPFPLTEEYAAVGIDPPLAYRAFSIAKQPTGCPAKCTSCEAWPILVRPTADEFKTTGGGDTTASSTERSRDCQRYPRSRGAKTGGVHRVAILLLAVASFMLAICF